MKFDVLEPFSLSEKQIQDDAMVLRTANVLANGLNFLYASIKKTEKEVLRKITDTHGSQIRIVSVGKTPEMTAVPLELVECAFRWYAVSLCDFVRCATVLGRLISKNDREVYAKKILKGIQAYRDKVGAHTAGLTQNRNDNQAERSFTPCIQVSWASDRFAAGEYQMIVRRGNVVSNTSSLEPWRLTEVHEQLCERYPALHQLAADNHELSKGAESE